MSNLNQMGSVDRPQGNIAVRNYSLVDIPDGAGVIFDTANQGSQTQARGVLLPTAAGAITPAAGVAIGLIPAGGSGSVRRHGVAVMTSQGAQNVGDFVAISSTAGKLGWAKASVTASQIGQIVGTASGAGACADGDPIQVDVCINKGS